MTSRRRFLRAGLVLLSTALWAVAATGDPLDGSTADQSTTGVLVFSGTVPVRVKVAHNLLRNNQFGIWLGVGGNVTASMRHNVFRHVTTPVFTSP